MSVVITEPGLVRGLPDVDYHADPVPAGSLSSTFARLLTENVPAKARALRDRPATGAMQFGTIAHRIVLGEESLDAYATDGLTVIEGDGRTKAVKEARAAAVAAGLTVVTPSELEAQNDLHQKLADMVAAIEASPEVAPLVNGDHEVSAFWQDDETGIWLRARFDILDGTEARDYKTTIDASRRGFQKSIGRYGYHQQADFYLRALRALGIAKKPTFRFLAQESTAPYLVNVHECDAEAMEVAKALNDRAIRIYAECSAAGWWPGYVVDPEPLPLPNFYFYDHEDVLPDQWSPSTELELKL